MQRKKKSQHQTNEIKVMKACRLAIAGNSKTIVAKALLVQNNVNHLN